jgi:hypothetical protein
MKRMQSIGVGAVLAAALLVGCGGDEDPPQDPPQASARCDSPTEYLAFDPVNHAPQDLRLAKFDEMMALFAQAEADASVAADRAGKILALYQGTDANLQAKVQGRKDVHFTPALSVGAELDATFTGAIEELRNAANVQDVKLAKQRFEKAGIFRFLYLSVAEELFSAPSLKHYDEAYGYLGSGQTNAEAARRGLARLATRRDGNNGTTLAAELFQHVLDGACALESAVKALGKDTFAPAEDAQYHNAAKALDNKLQIVFAYSVGHELFEYRSRTTDPNAAHIKLVEGETFFRTLEPYMKEAGGAKATLANELRAAFDSTLTQARNNEANWTSSFNSEALLLKLEQAFSIDVKG